MKQKWLITQKKHWTGQEALPVRLQERKASPMSLDEGQERWDTFEKRSNRSRDFCR